MSLLWKLPAGMDTLTLPLAFVRCYVPTRTHIPFPLEFYPIPYWEIYRDWDRSRWLNAIITTVWPQVSEFIRRMAHAKLDPVLNNACAGPSALNVV